jgi:endonuclease/exonuclease/phosphatase family metal-dependent hydrolase
VGGLRGRFTAVVTTDASERINPVADDERTFRVATYNIRSLRDDAAAVTRVLRSLQADVVCIQEAPRFLLWRTRCRQLARVAGMRVIGGGRAAAANLILADQAVEVHAVRNVKFSKDHRLSLRGAALVDVSIRGVRVTVVGTHLDGVDEPRLRHIDELFEVVSGFVEPERPYVIGVDVNAEPGSESWARLTDRTVDAAAVASSGDPMTNQPLTPTRRIDGLFVNGDLSVRSTEAVDSADVKLASDHRPVVAELWAPRERA